MSSVVRYTIVLKALCSNIVSRTGGLIMRT